MTPEEQILKHLESEGEEKVRRELMLNHYGEPGTRNHSAATEFLRSKESARHEGFAKEANLTAKSALVTATDALEIARQQKTIAIVALVVAIIAMIIGIVAVFR